MRKFFILIAIVFFLGSANIAYSASGACSYHGGVNCSAGSDWDGSVICNDGWQDSSVSYSSMVSCRESSYISPIPSPLYSCRLSSVSGCQTDEDLKQIERTWMRTGTGVAPEWQVTQCKQQIEENKKLKQQFEQCEISYKEAIEKNDKDNKELLKIYVDGVLGKIKESETKIRISQDASCQNSNGANSYYDSNSKKCMCNNGYELVNGKCINLTQTCIEQHGKNVHPYYGSCACDFGFSFNDQKECVPNPKPIKNISAKIKEWADNIKSPCESNGLGFSQEEITQCKIYQLHYNNYDWVITKPSIPTPSVPAVDQIIPIKETTAQKSKIPISTQPISQQKTQKQVVPNNQISTTTTNKANISNAKSEEVKQQKEAPSKKNASGKIKKFITKLKFW